MPDSSTNDDPSTRLTAVDTATSLALAPARPRPASAVVNVALGAIWLYRKTLSPILRLASGPAGGCRFYPSCSCYAADALKSHGLLQGGALALWRVLRCNPLSAGGLDPVPAPRLRTQSRPSRPVCTRA